MRYECNVRFNFYTEHNVWKSPKPFTQDELDSTSGLDSTCPLFVPKFALTDKLKIEMNQLKTPTSMLRKSKFLRTKSVFEITWNFLNFIAWKVCLKKLHVFANRFGPRNYLKYSIAFIACLEKLKILRIDSVYDIIWNNTNFHSWSSLLRKLKLFANRDSR